MAPPTTFIIGLIALAACTAQAANFKRVACPDGRNTAINQICCPFYTLRDDLQANMFHGQCGDEVHEVLRLSFHDAIVHSPALEAQIKFGGNGADGSMLLFPDVEPNYPENVGIGDIVDELLPFLGNHPVTAGDLIQFATAVGVANCPGSPRLQFLAGRKNASAPGPTGLVPEPQDSVDKMLARLKDGGNFDPEEVVALLASHSIGRAAHVDNTITPAPLDSTPFTFDSQFYLETLLKGTGFPGTANNTGEVASPLPLSNGEETGEIRLQSDFEFARDNRTSCAWQGFINEQEKMANAFSNAMAKLAVIGSDTKTLFDCSEAVPQSQPASSKPATYPATKSFKDIEQACSAPFPSLTTDEGAEETLIPRCPPNSTPDTCR